MTTPVIIADTTRATFSPPGQTASEAVPSRARWADFKHQSVFWALRSQLLAEAAAEQARISAAVDLAQGAARAKLPVVPPFESLIPKMTPELLDQARAEDAALDQALREFETIDYDALDAFIRHLA